MLTPWAIKKLQHLTLDYMDFDCGSSQCYGFVAVQRINWALGMFHLAMSIFLMGVTSTKNGRAGLQNGYWGPKIIAWLLLIVVSFLIPEEFFMFWSKYIALTGAMLFVLLGLILLVDLAYQWAEMCQDKIDASEGGELRVWQTLLVGSSLSMYLIAFVLTGVMYFYFAKGQCHMNITAITINLVLILITTIISVSPTVQENNPKAGIGQSAFVAVYCTYLTFSAVCMEPDDHNCNPLVRARGARTTTIVLGAIVTMITIAYTTTRAATYGFALSSSNAANNNYGTLSQEDNEHGLVTQQPATRREIMQAAIESGALPASALDDDDDDDEDDKQAKDDERHGTQYNYSLFHVIFLMATCWVATLLTQGFDKESDSDFTPVGRTYWASWIKIVSAWLCYAIYTWSLVAPSVLTGREFS